MSFILEAISASAQQSMPWELGYKIQVICIPLQLSLSLKLPSGIHSLVLCKTV